ncbi:ABC transporter permease [Nitratireductor aquimarinus]|uniref:ABC transporter permease n=1 Tax=Nitratireductor aquimarinus TaxID=889300 RepID=A0ABU4AP73_9HYPH|nr:MULTISPECIES: ABC transporter permease [Alphaproteobacteria]MBY6020159.1 ABC transporter permease [Nitratireductor sp. DP7N14-4]MBN7755377.1 ABC transporter permease [Nitratireductor aquimarinus]MBY5998132.1 ABC transporter permease [Tritonibacter mobilis]MDJ1463477.1 ABC transporter permease [Nitratireductor sp. GZWM139]MDV6228040.1 ABC transporter permease [Nitratireductor aquimarinus]
MSHDATHEQPATDAATANESGQRPVPFRGGGFVHRSLGPVAPLVFLAILAVWELGSRSGFISPIALPAPSEAFGALVDLFQTGMLWKHLGASLYRLVVGWTLGSLLGIAVGLFIGLFSLARAGLLPLVSALFPVPKIALLPLFIIWFGIGEGSKVATILFGTFFPTVIATYGGVDNVDRNLIRMGQSFGMSWLSIVRKIILPGAMPAILSGFRISASIAIVLLVAAEMIGAEFGVGAYILMAGALFALDQLIAGVALLSLIGLIIAWLIGKLEKRLLSWRT